MFKTNAKKEPFVMVPLSLLHNPKLSLKEKGILIYIMSKPPGWKFWLNDIVRNTQEGIEAIRNGIDSLIKKGYLKREQRRTKNGKFHNSKYTISISGPCQPLPDPPEAAHPDAQKDMLYVQQETNIVPFQPVDKSENKVYENAQDCTPKPPDCHDKTALPDVCFAGSGKTTYSYIQSSNIDLRKELLRNSYVELHSTMHSPNSLSLKNPKATALETQRPKASDKGKYKEVAERLLAFLNLRANRVFRPVGTNLDFIIARLKSGATEQDCKTLICRKIHDWRGTEMERYLRPATLFNKTKFEQYLGELVEKDSD